MRLADSNWLEAHSSCEVALTFRSWQTASEPAATHSKMPRVHARHIAVVQRSRLLAPWLDC
jgi:hypothetical protein